MPEASEETFNILGGGVVNTIEIMRTLEAEPPFRIKEVPVKQNPTPKATDELGNPKHWVKKRIEVRPIILYRQTHVGLACRRMMMRYCFVL